MDELPGEMVVAVLGWVEAPDLVASHQVCRRWRHLLSALGGGGLWRRSYLRTWPPPLSSAAHHAVIATAAQPIDWRALSLQRIGLQRHSDQQARMAEVAALLRSAATLAVPAPLGAEPEEASEEPNHGTTGAPAAEKKKKRKVMESESDDDKPKKKKKRKSKRERKEKESKKKKKKKRKRASSSSSESLSSSSEAEERKKVMAKAKKAKKAKKKRRVEEEETEESAQAARQSAHQRHIADVQGPVEKAQQVLAYLNRVAGLRQRAHQLLHSFGPQGKANASEKVSKEHLLTMLFHGNMLYGKIHHKEIDLGDVMHSVQYEASIVVYSLVTGLPLLMTYSSSYEGESSDKLSWKSLAGEKLEGVVEEMQCRAEAKADYAALQVFLFGWENADTVDPPALEKFIEGVFVPTNNYYVRCWVQWPRSE